MTKNEFLIQLRSKLDILRDDEIDDIINEYSDCIDEKISEGISEENAVLDFGDIDEFAKEILSAYKVKSNYKEPESNTSSKFGDVIDDIVELVKKAIESIVEFLDGFSFEKNISIDNIAKVIVSIFVVLIIIALMQIPFYLVKGIGHSLISIALPSSISYVLCGVWTVFTCLAYLLIVIIVIIGIYKSITGQNDGENSDFDFVTKYFNKGKKDINPTTKKENNYDNKFNKKNRRKNPSDDINSDNNDSDNNFSDFNNINGNDFVSESKEKNPTEACIEKDNIDKGMNNNDASDEFSLGDQDTCSSSYSDDSSAEDVLNLDVNKQNYCSNGDDTNYAKYDQNQSKKQNSKEPKARKKSNNSIGQFINSLGSLLVSIIVFCTKSIAMLCTIPFVFLAILMAVCFGICVSLLISGVSVFGLTAIMFSIFIGIVILLEFTYRIVLGKKGSILTTFIAICIMASIFGFGAICSFIEFLNYEIVNYVEYFEENDYQTTDFSYDVSTLNSIHTGYGHNSTIITNDETMSDDSIIIRIKHTDSFYFENSVYDINLNDNQENVEILEPEEIIAPLYEVSIYEFSAYNTLAEVQGVMKIQFDALKANKIVSMDSGNFIQFEVIANQNVIDKLNVVGNYITFKK